MKTALSFGLMFAAASTLFACSSDENPTRGDGGTGATPGNGGTGNVAGNTGGMGGTTTPTGGQGGGIVGPNYGPAFTINEDGTVTDTAGDTGVNGAALVVASAMNPSAVAAFRDGALCMSGATAIVVGGDYTNFWGAEIDLDLNRGANPDAPTGDAGVVADAGDAGVAPLGMTAMPWSPGSVLGFSFKIDGPTVAPVLSVKATPTLSDPSTDNFCYRGASPVAGQTLDVLFSDIRRDCWNAPPESASLFQDPSGYTQLQNLGWQISADVTIAYMFDFCISELKPIIP